MRTTIRARKSRIIIIVLLPLVGLISYIIFGFNPNRTRNFRKKLSKFLKVFRENTDIHTRNRLFGHDIEQKIRPEYQELAKMLSHSNGTTVSEHNEIEIFTSGQKSWNR